MTGAQLEAILKLSVGIEINKMYYKKYNLDKDEALEIISDMYNGTCNFLNKMQRIQELFYHYQLIEPEDLQDITYAKESIQPLKFLGSTITQTEFYKAVKKLTSVATDTQIGMRHGIDSAWKQWSDYVNYPLARSNPHDAINGKWAVTGCAVDGINLNQIARIAQGNACCSLITEKTQRLYNNRQVALLYNCDYSNTYIMCNGDLSTGLGSIHSYDLRKEIFNKFYKDFYNTSYLSVASIPEICNSGSKVFYDVLPLELMRDSIAENADCNVQNEIVIDGSTRPYGLLCCTNSLDYAKKVHPNLVALGWKLMLVELTKDHKLIRHI